MRNRGERNLDASAAAGFSREFCWQSNTSLSLRLRIVFIGFVWWVARQVDKGCTENVHDQMIRDNVPTSAYIEAGFLRVPRIVGDRECTARCVANDRLVSLISW